jgi:hypothetical protein
VKTEFLKMGSGAKVVAISNRLDGGLFKSLETLEPSTKLNGSVLQGLISPVHPAWLVIRRWLWTQTSILLHSSISCQVGRFRLRHRTEQLSQPGKQPHGVGIRTTSAGSFPIFLNGGIEADLAFTPNNMGQSLFCAVVMCSNKAAGSMQLHTSGQISLP